MPSENNEKGLKEALLGHIGQLKATGGHKADIEKLLQPLEDRRAVMHAFCEQCGTVTELSPYLVKIFAYILKKELPEKPAEHYFEVNGCSACDGEDKKPVALRPLPKIQ